ncbi:MAG TPA: hypothetical protein VJR05_01070 [Acidimicrobiia bacterium]|nr:hypothetical protein [Acidimicrobiia bacterium]
MKLLLATLALVLIPGVALAGGGGGSSLCPGFGTGATVSMLDSCFAGTAHFAPAGTELIVRNDGVLPHSYTATDGAFDSGQLQAGDSFSFTVSEPGIYQVYCSLHGSTAGEGMAGVLIVGEPAAPAVAATFDPSTIERAVAAETLPLAEAVNRQSAAIASLEASQAKLQTRLDAQEANRAPASSSTAPAVVAVPAASPDWLPLATGLAAGLAVAALATARRGKPSLPNRPGEELTAT